MGTREVTGGAAALCTIFFMIVCVSPVTSQCSHDDEATAAAPANSCPNHLIIADGCTPSSRPAHEGGDEKLRSATLTEAVVLALLTAGKDDTTELEDFLILTFLWAVFALLFSENPLRNVCPRFAQIVEMLVVIVFVNGVMASRLPTKFLWVPAVCLALSLLTFIVSPCSLLQPN